MTKRHEIEKSSFHKKIENNKKKNAEFYSIPVTY